ncbi:MAG: TonB-dependent receptor [Sulfurimicrobium sp.]|nr:TonB-dependent receptor [Sulfurimicrobium sp.]
MVNRKQFFLLACACLSFDVWAGPSLSEGDYFTDLPVVLSVSRLAQPLSDTPGAVTIIDRETIRRSGAREVADLLRLVPGFIVSHAQGGARPIASYHADYDAITRHLQVFVDGRSVYSTLLLGSANYGMMGVVLEDIERIEVLRGSNSAAYGANAFLGVVNIITRHSADTLGGMVSAGAGETNLRDGVARIGRGGPQGSFRLTASSRSDDGFNNIYDNSRLEQVHFRGDLQASDKDNLILTAGATRFRWGVPDDVPPANRHDEAWRNSYAHLDWTRQINSSDQFKVSVSADEEAFSNYYPLLRADSTGRRFQLEAQHNHVVNREWRLVWGGQYRHEQAISPDLFYANPEQSFSLWRLFGNVEWRPHEQWVINAGGLWENHGIIGENSAPRLMVNYHMVPGHTLRVGATSAYKQPTLVELRADWRYSGVPVIQASGRARPERVDSTEIGYLGEFKKYGVTIDVRAFEENVSDLLRYEKACKTCPNDLVNKDPNTQRGWETQLRWQPQPATQILVNHTELRLQPDASSTAPQDAFRAPRHFSTLALFQKLSSDWDLSLIHTSTASLFWVRQNDATPAFRQTDVRLARRFRIGDARAEAALTVRAADGGHVEFVEAAYPVMVMDRRAVASLRLDF